MTGCRGLAKMSTLALQQRRQGLAKLLSQAEDTLRGSLIVRCATCGNPDCKCARAERPGPVWHLPVTLGPGGTPNAVVARHELEAVRRWIANYRTIMEDLEKISEINRRLLRSQRKKAKRTRFNLSLVAS